MNEVAQPPAFKEQVFCNVCRKPFNRTSERMPWPPKCRRCVRLYGPPSGMEPDHDREIPVEISRN